MEKTISEKINQFYGTKNLSFEELADYISEEVAETKDDFKNELNLLFTFLEKGEEEIVKILTEKEEAKQKMLLKEDVREYKGELYQLVKKKVSVGDLLLLHYGESFEMIEEVNTIGMINYIDGNTDAIRTGNYYILKKM